MRLTLSARRKERTNRGFEVAVIVAAVATLPLTYVHMQEWDGLLLHTLDWLLWAVFATEYGFALAVSGNRWRTTRAQWLNVAIIVLSFPLLPELLGLTRLVRLIRPIRVIGGLRIGRPLVVLRLYVMRSAVGRRIFRKAEETGHADRARAKLDDARGDLQSRIPGRGDEGG